MASHHSHTQVDIRSTLSILWACFFALADEVDKLIRVSDSFASKDGIEISSFFEDLFSETEEVQDLFNATFSFWRTYMKIQACSSCRRPGPSLDIICRNTALICSI
jgi:hypothetical protein